MNKPNHFSININDYQIAAYKWIGDGPTILFCHATGFHGRIWDQVIKNLTGFNCVSIDLRGHGNSDKPDGSYDWDTLVPDVLADIHQLELRNIIGVGHSMGGHVITKVAIAEPKIIQGLILCDPSIFEKCRYRYFDSSIKKEHPISKRRNIWNSSNEMIERLQKHENFSLWESDVLKDYCNHGLEPIQDSTSLKLKCPPTVEAKMYGAYINPSIIQDITQFYNPVHIMLARKPLPKENFSDLGPSITRQDLEKLFPNATSERFHKNSHFLPMENTVAVSKSIKEMVISLS